VRLTAAESKVLTLLPTHLTVEAIGERLGRHRSTVKTHIAHIYKKLGVGTRGEAVARAREAGFLPNIDVDE
jgi:LuxR family maltose regulon positive regulatory protein